MTFSRAFLLLCATAYIATTSTAFRLQLHNVDDNANRTMAERVSRAAARAHLRFASSSGVTLPVGEAGYIVEYGIGDPQQVVQAAVDFTTNLVWTQCSTCQPNCFAQNLDYYNYSLSKTDYAVICDEDMCADGYGYETQRCAVGDGNGRKCAAQMNYGVGRNIAGALHSDDFTFGSAKVYMGFGCMRESSFRTLGGPSGYIGLGRGRLSLVSQVGGRRFSYCFTRHLSNHPSALFVGASAGLSGKAPVISAPLAKNPHHEPFSSYYYLPLTGMTVGETRLHIPAKAFDTRWVAELGVSTGGVIMYPGFPYTFLADAAYMALKQELTRQLRGFLVPSPADSLELCVARADVRVPPLVLHFAGGGQDIDLTLPAENYWMTMDLQTSCMAVFNSAQNGQLPWNETNLIGSYMQQDMHVLYDLDSETIFFQPTDCTSI